ncbi:hypothetical protein [Herpetosiphon gulosus]|uniref:Uncharacterized protein n=1 Tax=Herpetosiphon gulosus TaxID=1973496 RepID=A0ABP9X2L3_9CHLR
MFTLKKEIIIYTLYIKKKDIKKERYIPDNGTIVIVQGWNTPDLPDNLKIMQNDEIMIVSTMRHEVYSNEWIEEFNSIIDPWIQSNPERLILDLRKRPIENTSTVEEDWSTATQANFFDLPAIQPYQSVVSPEIFIEGAEYQSLVTRYERNPEARQRCIDHYGSACFICDFDFAKVYGDLGSV